MNRPRNRVGCAHVKGEMRIGIVLMTGFLALFHTVQASAETATAQFNVTVHVVPNCRIAVTDLAFGAYDPLVLNSTQSLDGTALVRVNCTKNERATILMEENAASRRVLAFAGYELAYGLYSDSARTTVWGGRGSGVLVRFEGGSTPQEL